MIIRIILATVLILLTGCIDRNMLIPASHVRKVEKDFREREVIPYAYRKELKLLFRNTSDSREEESIKFLYAYMPLSDLADYTVQFFSENVRMALKARDELKWGKSIPQEIFLHYVLPVRVNNEDLDAFRIVMYDELKERVTGLDLAGAVLEINRWCHEKVTYQPSDIRTSSPLATMLSSRGRCGEESTFTVAALRTIGIPARQVYTPRWAHSDDNHAWVEVWIEGEWYYLGACEPEQVLDRGWFTEPARRAMLVHTKAFGAYMGNENTIRVERSYSEINNLSKYAETKVINVVVTNDGKPVSGIDVEFCLYNYAEFYPIAIVKTNENGLGSFETGLGDLHIWSGTGDMYGFSFVSVGNTDTVQIALKKKTSEKYSLEIDLSPPVTPEPLPALAKDIIEFNFKLLARGDSIRNAYISTWITNDRAAEFANKYGYDDPIIADLIIDSHGNYTEITTFLEDNVSRRDLAVEMLRQVSLKDLRDAQANILSEHLISASEFQNNFSANELSLFYDYVLNPRIANEFIAPWRRPIRERFLRHSTEELTDDGYISGLINQIADRFKISDDENHYGTPVTPLGALNVSTLDSWSRKIFTVAMFRSVGVPSRLEPGTNRPQYYINGIWNTVWFADEEMITSERSVVSLNYDVTAPEPEYYIHYTLARHYNGRFNTLSYDYNKKVSSFEDSLSLFPGDYLMVKGNRTDDGKILASLMFFNLSPGKSVELNVTPRSQPLRYTQSAGYEKK